MAKVILIGGSPMCGKSTIAKTLALKLGWTCISTDDIGEVLQTLVDINPMKSVNYMDYYANTDKGILITDIIKYHTKIQPAILRLIEIHSTWGSPTIIEGWAIYPDIMDEITSDSVKAVWLISDESLLRNRLMSNIEFCKSAINTNIIQENYLYRSLWHNNFLFEQCKQKNQKYILLNGKEEPEELATRIEEG